MLLGITIDETLSAEQVRYLMSAHLYLLAQENRLIMRQERFPPLYSSGIRYQVESGAGWMQALRTCREALAERTACCKVASAYRLAELQEQAPNEALAQQYGIHVDWKDYDRDPLGADLVPVNGVVRIFHARVSKPDGTIEDPSRKLRRR